MQFMMMMKADEASEAGAAPNPELMTAMDAFVAEMTRSGALLFTGGLQSSRHGIRLIASGGKLEQVDGPFAETKELIAGFAIVQTKTREEALAWAHRFMKIHTDILGPTWRGASEIRQMFGPEDFTPCPV